jgi:DNA-directed RNA polymerase specialized sigma24 family protein
MYCHRQLSITYPNAINFIARLALMKRETALTPESFEALLAWLDNSRDAAGQQYETIRRRLIKIFVNKGCIDAEDLADRTISVVVARLPEVRDGYTGEKISYFCGVARKVYLESRRRKEVATDTFPQPRVQRPDVMRDCLRECLEGLPSDQRELVLEYYLYEKRAKIDHRKQLAEELGVTANALRLRAHHTRVALEECVRRCAGI